MKILVYGAGVLGCNLAKSLLHAGKDVTLLARGKWAEEIEKNGLRIKNVLSRHTSVSHMPVVTTLAPDDLYDVIFVVMRYTPEGESAVRSKLGTLGKYKLKSRTMNLAETELVVEAKLSQKQMDSLEALLDNEGVSDVNIVSYNGSTLL